LENSEKSLTFAARFFLENARKQDDEGLKKWMANESKELFEKALVLDPGNDSLKVGLGSCYIFGNIADNPMQGIMMIREVAERDPSNMYAQYMLGVGGLMSGQLDRAIDRLSVVASKQPDNVEVKLMLAEAYERKGDKQNAVKWYESVRSHIGNPEILQELDKRIQTLKK
jgi:cytochrome c-type biogenesis protein CcmH/NrfG